MMIWLSNLYIGSRNEKIRTWEKITITHTFLFRFGEPK